jgi:hypothetical protein
VPTGENPVPKEEDLGEGVSYDLEECERSTIFCTRYFIVKYYVGVCYI